MAARPSRSMNVSAMRSLLQAGDFETAISSGRSGLKCLKAIAAGTDVALAVKAVHVAGATGLAEAAPIVAAAAASRKTSLKTAAAAAARSLPAAEAEPILRRLLKSRDISVRKWAIRSIDALGHRPLFDILDDVRNTDSNEFIRQLAHSTRIKRLSDPP